MHLLPPTDAEAVPQFIAVNGNLVSNPFIENFEFISMRTGFLGGVDGYCTCLNFHRKSTMSTRVTAIIILFTKDLMLVDSV